MKCYKCYEEHEFDEFENFLNYGLSLKIELCEICIEELKEILDKFFKETQIVRIN